MDHVDRRKIFALLLLLSLFIWLCAGWLYLATRPQFGAGTVEFPGKAPVPVAYPFLQKKAPKSKFILRQSIELSSWHPNTFAFYPQDALWEIKVNGHQIKSSSFPLSRVHHQGRSISLAPYLQSGANEVEFDMEVYWGEAALHVYMSPWDKISILLAFLVLAAASATVAFLLFCLGIKISPAEASILLGGFLLRYIYVLGTPYYVRAYDWWGHEAYLDYVARNLSLPDPHSDWESYQAPLYYCLLGGLTKLALYCGLPDPDRYVVWQGFSLICSAGALLAGLWIARLLYNADAKARLYLLAILAVAPPLVFNASRVSNDVLINLLDFVWFGFLLQFWKRHDLFSWLGLSIVLGLALITKANALALVPVSLLCLYLAPGDELRKKISRAIALLVVVTMLSGWYYFARAFRETGVDSYIVGNIHELNPKGHIHDIFLKSLSFNPFKVLRYPFAEPWGPHNEYFLEYFFRSAFLGDGLGSAYRWIGRTYILMALLLVPVFLRGLWLSAKERTGCDVPMIVTFITIFLAQWTFVQIAPYVSSQDFRFSVILLVPILYFFAKGSLSLFARGQAIAFFCLQLLILNSAIYMLEIALEG